MHRDSSLSDMGPRTAADGDRLSFLSDGPELSVPADIRALSDMELVRLTRALRSGFQAYAWLCVPLATLAAALLAGALAAAAAFVVAAAACKLAVHGYERSKAKERGLFAKREFCARFHIGSLKLDQAVAQRRLASDAAIDAVLLFRAWALPHGGHRFVRIELGRTPNIAVYTTPFLGDLQRHPELARHMAKLERPLTDAQQEQLHERLASLTAADMPSLVPRSAEHEPLASLPCDVVVLQRECEPLRASMSLQSAAVANQSGAEALVSTVMAIESEVIDSERFAVDPLLSRHYTELAAEPTWHFR